MKFAAIAALAVLLATPAGAQATWPVCQVDRFSVGGVATGAADPTFNANAAAPAMRLRRGGSCSVGIAGPRLSISVLTAPANGTARIDGNRIHYDARPGFAGDDTFTVRMFAPDRSQNNTAFLTFRVQVRDAAPAPVTPSATQPSATPPRGSTDQLPPLPPPLPTPQNVRPPVAPRAASAPPASPRTQPAATPAAQAPPPPPQPSPASPAVQGAPSPRDVAARLRQLQQLREQGLVTEDEYKAQRQRILDAL